jgi:hypothetical protein
MKIFKAAGRRLKDKRAALAAAMDGFELNLSTTSIGL